MCASQFSFAQIASAATILSKDRVLLTSLFAGTVAAVLESNRDALITLQAASQPLVSSCIGVAARSFSRATAEIDKAIIALTAIGSGSEDG